MAREKADPINWHKRYSHSSEDYILRMLFPYKTGIYVDVGSWKPDADTNTFIFYEMGWKGILVDPVGYWIRKAKEIRPRDIGIETAISNKDNEILQFKIDKEQGKDCAANSLRDDWFKEGKSISISITTTRMDTLINNYPEIRDNCDFCDIDVEGWEKKVIESIDFKTFKPTVFCIESVRWNPFYRVHQDWEKILIDNGYKLICHNLQNRFYGRIDNKELWENVKLWNLEE